MRPSALPAQLAQFANDFGWGENCLKGTTETGRRHRRPVAGYLDEALTIDVRRWARSGLLGRAGRFVWEWTEDDRAYAAIGVETDSEQCILSYRSSGGGQASRAHCDTVRLTRTACHFGGGRFWFICPVCGRRCAKLYHAGAGFRCRRCQRRPYRSQSETRLDGHLRRLRRVRQRLGASLDPTDPVLGKPRGMHWRSFERWCRIERRFAATFWAEAHRRYPLLKELGVEPDDSGVTPCRRRGCHC